MGVIVGDEVSRMVTRARAAIEKAYDSYALRKFDSALALIAEAEDCMHNARLSLHAEGQIRRGDIEGARLTLRGLITLRE